uniref:U3-cyrtautoxin-As1a n=1 Tax=Apomastus schlingeri TaxID=12944 RepID=TXP7_APOSC|nr:RecName: Full=U3-cyrtautoxin-As1a; Short=U3-CUTX-As1a; AltName: Full=Aptotoxin VII; AltName: Full=Aptotoxin-7; AltName: Full=Paralytic peptide VII; Short=PP VII [Apomastus schlingeri]AAB24048.1 aptotoxin VII, Aps VII=insecticidal peptide [Aptostichus schlingeri=trap-door spiders, venom, Peptide, 32 aa] [Apomastus schlingeri]1WQB_A Chain A, Aptotoxin VII [synthetic construct]
WLGCARVKEACGPWEWPCCSGLKCDGSECHPQ